MQVAELLACERVEQLDPAHGDVLGGRTAVAVFFHLLRLGWYCCPRLSAQVALTHQSARTVGDDVLLTAYVHQP